MIENLESLKFVNALTEEDMEKISALNINLRKYVKLYGIPWQDSERYFDV